MAADDSLETVGADEGTLQMAKLMKELSDDPKTRKRLLSLIKEKNPGQPIPELDTEDAINKALEPRLKKIEQMEQEFIKRDVVSRIEARRRALRDEGFSADDVTAIEAMMVKEQIPNYDTAKNYYKLQKSAAAPTPTAQDMVNRMPVDKKSIKEAGGIKNWARTEAGKAIDDLKAGRVKVH